MVRLKTMHMGLDRKEQGCFSCSFLFHYDIIAAEKKEAAAKADIYFSRGINEQTPDEIGQKAREREFASLDDRMSA